MSHVLPWLPSIHPLYLSLSNLQATFQMQDLTHIYTCNNAYSTCNFSVNSRSSMQSFKSIPTAHFLCKLFKLPSCYPHNIFILISSTKTYKCKNNPGTSFQASLFILFLLFLLLLSFNINTDICCSQIRSQDPLSQDSCDF